MSEEAKVEFTVGAISFAGEGDKEWLASQLDKILDKAPGLMKLTPPEQSEQLPLSDSQQPSQEQDSIAQKNLPVFLQEKNANAPQVRKFLATAVWLIAQGHTRLSTRDVTQALRESRQSRLSNASDCLNRNVSKGYCEKIGNEFFVTQEGKDSL